LSQFSRRARWLQDLFTPSVAPHGADPSVVSDDVSLVTQYDGGGIGFSKPSFPAQRDGDAVGVGVPLLIESPEVAIRSYLTGSGINVSTDLYVMPTGLYARFLLISTNLNDGITPTKNWFTLDVPTGTPGGGFQANLTNIDILSTSQVTARGLLCSILPPGMMLKFHHRTGDIDTQIRIGVIWIVAPVGSIIINTGVSANVIPSV